MTQPSNAPQPDSAALTDIFRRMLRIERNDDAILSTIRKGRLQMPYYSARGQEVIPATISHFLTDEDQICTIYRGIQDMVAKDMPLKPLWAEIAGRVDGTCKGKGGPMHLTHPPTGVMVTTGVVGSSMPIANGLAWAAKLDGSRRVVIAYFGDGASNIGAFHESLNLASLWKLPVIFVCPNNGFAEHTRFENGTSVDRISKRAIGYGMPGFTVDGNDPWEMYAQVSTAIARARDGEGPTLLECTTFRFLGHVLGDDNKYMAEGELAAARERDPLPLFRQRLLDEGHVDEPTLAAMQEKIEAEVAEARDFGLASELPPVDEIRRDVFAQEMMA
ncbi:thiamine pyrophosphate-dependent dehydrogenase E1 component subunit alpha [Novosphingobium sp. BW1]|uniref:thiamine pyrophosphate-dependent dehydrogenase E1 component subunit alpha n=1 Tax=Novosphingobium sp. BW1 TaxID=2592621 RepID=UPI0011DE6CA1|nr:thiamine pyrophosphate-dependent dehydrogenase E1 component subunit alpha [Novosphingobium sp. BW1]TYC89637.1 thiamine pyrophosphate-dependent dehydrogenase E1 component subunit alpha [Novosphingobium sp. BW1]